MIERQPESPADGTPAPRGATVGAASPGPGGPTSTAPRVTDCSETVLRIFELLDGEMTPADCRRIQAHLDECGPCLREYQVDQALKAVIKRSCTQEAAPVELRTTILRRLTMVRVESRSDSRVAFRAEPAD